MRHGATGFPPAPRAPLALHRKARGGMTKPAPANTSGAGLFLGKTVLLEMGYLTRVVPCSRILCSAHPVCGPSTCEIRTGRIGVFSKLLGRRL